MQKTIFDYYSSSTHFPVGESEQQKFSDLSLCRSFDQ